MIGLFYRFIGLGARKGSSILSCQEALVLDILGEQELFGKEIVAASNGAIKRSYSYGLLARMERKNLLAARKIKKVLVTRHEWMGEMHKWEKFIWMRLYRRGVPEARTLKPSERARRDKARLLSNGEDSSSNR